jgi:hypothetical protein
MRLNLETIILDADFNPALEDGKPVNVRTILRRALLNTHPDESKKITEEEKHKRFMLACKVHEAQIGEDFAAHEIKDLLAATHLFYGILIYGQVSRVLSRDDAPLLERMQPSDFEGRKEPGAYANGKSAALEPNY